jgi:hypothetical protein
MMSRPKMPQQPQAPAVAAPAIVQAPPPPPPPPPVPPAPNPYYDQQQASDAQQGLTQARTVARARSGRAGLKIDLVNSAGDAMGSGVNTAS